MQIKRKTPTLGLFCPLQLLSTVNGYIFSSPGCKHLSPQKNTKTGFLQLTAVPSLLCGVLGPACSIPDFTERSPAWRGWGGRETAQDTSGRRSKRITFYAPTCAETLGRSKESDFSKMTNIKKKKKMSQDKTLQFSGDLGNSTLRKAALP